MTAEEKKRKAEYAIAYYWRNREKLKKALRKSYAKHKVRRRKDCAEWQKRNRRSLQSYNQQYREKHKEKIDARSRKWKAANPDAVRSHNSKRRAIIANCEVEDIHAVKKFRDSLGSEGFTCAYCGKWFDLSNLHVDHAIPLARGGRHSISNLAASCAKCNLRKGTKLPSEF